MINRKLPSVMLMVAAERGPSSFLNVPQAWAPPRMTYIYTFEFLGEE